MIPEPVADLMLRVLENPHDAAARAALDHELASQPEWRGEWEELQATYETTSDAFASRIPSRDAIPASRLTALRDVVAKQRPPARVLAFPLQNLLGLAAAVALLAMVGRNIAPSPIDPASELATRLDKTSLLHHALTAPLTVIERDTTLTTFRSDASAFTLLGPLVATRAGNVTIAWNNSDPTAPRHVQLFEADRLLWETTQASSPIQTPALAADRVFEIRIRDAENTLLAREEFLTVAAPAAPADPLAAIVADATASPARLGDAVIGWFNLPPELATTPVARRLGLWLAHEANLPSLREAALAR